MQPFPTNPSEVQAFLASVPDYANDVDDPNFKPTEEIEALQNTNLVRQLDLVARGSRHYQGVFAETGIDPADIRTVHDLADLPVTTKTDYMADPEGFRLELPERSLYDITYTTTYTSGTTTGIPTPFYNTAHDVFGWMHVMGQRAFKISYLTPDDRIFSAFPVAPIPHIGFLNLPFMVGALGATWSAGFGGASYPDFPLHRSTPQVLDRMERLQPTCVMGIASFLRRLFRVAADEGRDLSSIRHVWAAGEAAPKGMRDDIRSHLQLTGAEEIFVNNGFGFTEAQVQWCECHELGRLHNPDPTQFYVEVTDADSGRRLDDGELGMLTITHLNRRGTVLLRYATGDIAAVTREPCPFCGRTGDQIVVKVGSSYATRTSELTKIRGELVNPEAIKDRVAQIPGVVEYQVVIDKEDPADPYSMDRLLVRVAVEGESEQQVADLIRTRVADAVMVRPKVEFVSMTDIYDPLSEFKARRVVDLRSTT